VARLTPAGHFKSGLDHYMRYGFNENRRPFFLDRKAYTASYPMAALELGQGDFLDCHHHFVEVGRARGYER
jgi:hypothetical protein